MNAATLALRVDSIEAGRQKTRRLRFLTYAVILIAVAWSIEVIVVRDTDWSRISLASLLESAIRFAQLDLSVVGEDLWKATLETVVMATLATVLGLVMSIPVAWLGAANITPFGKTSYTIGRFLMTMSRSVHEIVWGLIFVSAVGLGALAGVLAMAVRSIGFISPSIVRIGLTLSVAPIQAEAAPIRPPRRRYSSVSTITQICRSSRSF